VQVLRFWNRAVLQETEAVLQAIWEALPARLAGPASGGAGEARGEGGFDVVIGNPPYIRIQTMQEWIPASVEYFKRAYRAASKGNYDIYVVFVEKGLSLLNRQGRLGFILPSKFFATDYGKNLRQLISNRRALSQIVDFGHGQVFEQATTYTCLLFLSGSVQHFYEYVKVDYPQRLTENLTFRKAENLLEGDPWVFADDSSCNLAQKIHLHSTCLNDLPARIGRGSSSGADQVFVLHRDGNRFLTRQGENIEVEEDILRIPVYATDFGRYEFRPKSNDVIIFPYRVDRGGYSLIAENELRKAFPKAYKYLAGKKNELEKRKQYKTWYSFSAPRNLDVHETAQILVPLLADRGLYCRLYDESLGYCLMASGGFSITIASESNLSPNYVLGLLNSRLLFWRLHSISNVFRGGWITCTKQYVETLPIRTIDPASPADVQRHDRLVALVEQMLALHQQLAAAKMPQEKELLQRQVSATDRAIDTLVYELYGLTDEEIRIVEGEA